MSRANTSSSKNELGKGLRLGLKMKTTNLSELPEVKASYREGVFDYIELYVVPATYAGTVMEWKALNIPIILHAPHTADGVNIADRALGPSNLRAYAEVQRFADTLATPLIIVHGGCNGSLEEAVNQLGTIHDPRLYIENKPMKGLGGEICRGCSPEEIRMFLDEKVVHGLVLDFGHAVYAARSLNMDPMDLIDGYMQMEPALFHLSDGHDTSEKDMHLNLGKGNLDIEAFCRLIPAQGMLTLETPRSTDSGLNVFLQDVRFLNRVYQEVGAGPC